MKTLGRMLFLTVATIITVVLVLSACAPKAKPIPEAAKKPTVVKIMMINDFTGPYAPIVGPMRLGYLDATKYINEELGGINGVRVEALIGDMEGKPELIMPFYSRFVSTDPKPVLIGGMDTQTGQTLHDRLVEEGIIGIGSSPDSVYPYGNSFGMHMGYSSAFGGVIDFAVDKWRKAGKTGKPKLATFSWDTAYGRSFMNAAAKSYFQDKVDLVGEYYHPVKALDITPYVSEAKVKGADIVYNGSSLMSLIAQIKAMKEQEWQPFIACSVGVDQSMLNLTGPGLEGWYQLFWFTTWNEVDTNPGVKKLNDYFVKSGWDNKKDRGAYYFYGWASALAGKKVIEDTVARVGWDKLNAAEMKKTILAYTKSFPITVDGGTLCYWGGFSKTEYMPNVGRMLEIKKDPKAWLGSLGSYPLESWRETTQLVTDNMKQTGRD